MESAMSIVALVIATLAGLTWVILLLLPLALVGLPITGLIYWAARYSSTKETVNAGHDLRILVVDDDPAIRDLFKESLTQIGHAVITASDAKEAMEHMDPSKIDLMILDYEMPQLNGEQAVTLAENSLTERRALTRHLQPNIPFVVCSSYDDRCRAWDKSVYSLFRYVGFIQKQQPMTNLISDLRMYCGRV